MPLAAPVVLLASAISIGWFALRDLADGSHLRAAGTLALVLPALLASWLALGVSRRSDLPRRDVTGWLFVGLAAGAASVSSLVLLLPDDAITNAATPMIGTIAQLAMLVCATIGVLHWVRRLSPSATMGTVLDLLCVAALAYVVAWRTVLSSALLGTGGAGDMIDRVGLLATPALGTLLLVAVVTVLSQVGRENIHGTELLATFGLGGIVATELAMVLQGVGHGGVDEAWRATVLDAGSVPVSALGWMLGIAAIGFAAALRRIAPVRGANLPLIERSTTWELVVSLIPFALLGVVLTTIASIQVYEHRIASRGLLAMLGSLLLLRCTLVAAGAIRSARTSDTDHLTNALSHRAFQERLPLDVELALANDDSIALIVFDVDDFGLLNDACSHAEGDRFLQQISWIVRQELLNGEALYRNGGDEFAIVVPGATKREAHELAVRVRELISRLRERESVQPALTMAIAALPEDAPDVNELVQVANGTLYWAKLNSKASITCYDPAVVKTLSAEERLEMLERTARLRAVLALARALDARDAYTARHSENVARYAEAIAQELGWTPDRIELLRTAGMLHDVGKIGVRDSTLRKIERLSESEWQEMQQHPELGARMIAGVAPDEIVPWVMSHHERVDGEGYPHQLAGDAIPDGARVLAVADTFDAMTSSRSYRPALSPLRAIDALVSGAGTQFDGEVVRAFLRALKSRAIDVHEVERAARTAPAQLQHVPDDADVVAIDPEFRRTADVVELPHAA